MSSANLLSLLDGMRNEIDTLISKAPSYEITESPDVVAERIEDVERQLNIRFPERNREFLLTIGTATFSGPDIHLRMFEMRNLPTFNIGEDRFEGLRDMLTFADNGGDSIYIFDMKNALGKGIWAIHEIDMGAASPAFFDYAHWVGDDLIGFLEKLARGGLFYE